MFFVSTGRCGTTRVAEILRQKLPHNFTVLHQTRYSRRANIVGNFLYHFSIGKICCDWLFKQIIRKNVPTGSILISTDPLISMIIPDEVVRSSETVIVHVRRDSSEFAQSMYNLTRKKRKSFIAHNFIPFWQPYLWPLENRLSKSIIEKYKKIHREKNILFKKKYKCNPHYIDTTTNDIFTEKNISTLINKHFNIKINISTKELTIKTNSSDPESL